MQHKFVDFIPDNVEDGILYISLDYGTVIHNCACGCGNEVNTPLSPIAWRMIYNGESVSLKPSIGNWSFKCKSHYWITDSEIEWSSTWTDNKIKKVREEENDERNKYYESIKPISTIIEANEKETSNRNSLKKKWWLWKLIFGD